MHRATETALGRTSLATGSPASGSRRERECVITPAKPGNSASTWAALVLRYMYLRFNRGFPFANRALQVSEYARPLPTLRHPVVLFALLTLVGSAALTREQYRHASPPRVEPPRESWAQKTLKTLSLEEKVGQLFMIRLRVEFLNGRSPGYFSRRFGRPSSYFPSQK